MQLDAALGKLRAKRLDAALAVAAVGEVGTDDHLPDAGLRQKVDEGARIEGCEGAVE